MEGVEGKQGGHEAALPEFPRHPSKDKEQQQSVRDVKEYVG